MKKTLHRYLSASEAAWKMRQFKITDRSHSVQKLSCHLENDQYIVYPEDNPQQGLERGALHTTLTAYFLANGPPNPDDPDDKLTAADRLLARTLTYSDFPSKFTFLNRRWHRRQSGIGKTIGRIPIIPYNIHCMEKYALRLILHNKRGASSYADLKTVNGVTHISFQAAAIALGLLEDDAELDKALDEASEFKFGDVVRKLFLSILVLNHPSDPLKFYTDHRLIPRLFCSYCSDDDYDCENRHQLFEDWARFSSEAAAESRFQII